MNAPDWNAVPRAALDFETTGTDPLTARIVSAAWVTWPNGPTPVVREWIVDPGIEIPAEAATVHGITTERARAEGGDPGQMLFELTGLVALALGRRIPVIVYNAPYDLTLLDAENDRHGVDTLTARLGAGLVGPIIDPLTMAKHAAPRRMVSVKDDAGQLVYREGSKASVKECRGCACGATDWSLTSTCAHYGVPLLDAHAASADAIAASQLFAKLMAAHLDKFAGLGPLSLHRMQIGWAHSQAMKLRGVFNWLRVADHDECPNPANHQCVCPSWPMHVGCCAPAKAVA